MEREHSHIAEVQIIMPLLSIFRFITTLLSWAILGAASYLLWSWWDGTMVVDAAGSPLRIRQNWMLWAGVGLGVCSVLGRLPWCVVLARGHDPVRPAHGQGAMLEGPDGTSIFVEQTGRADRPTLVLTHGAGCDSTTWYLARERLGREFRLLLWDLPGLGRSRGKVDLETYAECLAAVVKRANGPVVVVGHSMGGMVIQTLARRRPDIFRDSIVGTVLLNTTYTNPLKTMIMPRLAQALRPVLELGYYLQILLLPLSWLSALQSYLSGSAHLAVRVTFGRGVTRTQLDHAAAMTVKQRPSSIARGNLAMFRWDATGAVANIPGSVLIIGAEGDIVTKCSASEKISGDAVAPQLHVLPYANHMSYLDHAGDYHRLISAFASDAFIGSGVRR